MNTIVHKNNALASYCYLASLTLYMLPTIYLFINPVGEIPAPALILVLSALLLGFLIAVGIQLKAGKKWAKVLVLLYVAAMSMVCLSVFPTLFRSPFLTILRTLTFFALNLGVLFFLSKAYRAAAYEPSVTQKQ